MKLYKITLLVIPKTYFLKLICDIPHRIEKKVHDTIYIYIKAPFNLIDKFHDDPFRHGWRFKLWIPFEFSHSWKVTNWKVVNRRNCYHKLLTTLYINLKDHVMCEFSLSNDSIKISFNFQMELTTTLNH